MQKFRLFYHITNNGDGSASVVFHQTEKAAEQADEDLDEGWGEPCNGSLDILLKDGKLFTEVCVPEIDEDGEVDYNDELKEIIEV